MRAMHVDDCSEDISLSYGTMLIEEVFDAISPLLPIHIRNDFESFRRAGDREGMEYVCWERAFGWLNCRTPNRCAGSLMAVC